MESKLIWLLKSTIKKIYNLDIDDIKLDIPPKKDLWDFAFWVFLLARLLKKNPQEIANELSLELEKDKLIKKSQTAWPYINISLNWDIYTESFKEYIKGSFEDKFKEIWKNENIVVDYVWANVWKPLHIGHMCTPNIGQALINLYKRLGYNVISDSHLWDWGIIFGKLILAYKVWWDKEKLEENAVNYLFELYVRVSKYIEESWIEWEQKARDEFKLLSQSNKESVELWKEFTSYSIKRLDYELWKLNVSPDYDIWESFYEWIWLPKLQDYPDLEYSMKDIVQELLEKWIATKNEDNSVGVVFKEELNIPSCILQKKDWTHWYLASDLACVKYRMINWNPKKIIYSVDVRQQLHLKQVFEISKMASWINDDTELFHAYNWFISLKDWAMSTRKWRIIKLEDLLLEAEKKAEKIILEKRDDIEKRELEELKKIIWIGAIKYWYLKNRRENDVIFDWDEFMTFEWNSWPYIQYSYVRAIRILENYDSNINIDINASFKEKEETDLVKLLLEYEEVLKEAETKKLPSILCKYAYSLTKSFSVFYNNIHILDSENEAQKILRLQLVNLFAVTLKDVFLVLGIEMPNKM